MSDGQQPGGSHPAAGSSRAASPPAPGDRRDPSPISRRLEDLITDGLTSKFGAEPVEQCTNAINKIREALLREHKIFPELDALFHLGHQPQNPEKQVRLFASILDPHKLSLVLDVIRNHAGTSPSEAVSGGSGGTRVVLPAIGDGGSGAHMVRPADGGSGGDDVDLPPPREVLSATGGSGSGGGGGGAQEVLTAGSGGSGGGDAQGSGGSGGGNVDVHEVQPTGSGGGLNEVLPATGDGGGNVDVHEVQPTGSGGGLNEALPATGEGGVNVVAAARGGGARRGRGRGDGDARRGRGRGGGDARRGRGLPEVLADGGDSPEAEADPVAGGGDPPEALADPPAGGGDPPEALADPAAGGGDPPEEEQQQQQQQGNNIQPYDGHDVHGLTRQRFNKFIARFKAGRGLDLKEYICILRNTGDFDIQVAPLAVLKEGVVLYQVPPHVNPENSAQVSDGGADGAPWIRLRSFSRMIGPEKIWYTRYQREGNTNWYKKVYKIRSVNNWVVIHYTYCGEMPKVESMAASVATVLQSFQDFKDGDDLVCEEIETALGLEHP